MSNAKLRKLARVLPWFPQIQKNGEWVKVKVRKTGAELQKENPGGKDGFGNDYLLAEIYVVEMTPCVNHFDELKKIYSDARKNGDDVEQALRKYCNLVHEFDVNRRAREETKKSNIIMAAPMMKVTKD